MPRPRFFDQYPGNEFRFQTRTPIRIHPLCWIGLWAILFLICWGLGYSTLNRYDVRRTGIPDVKGYYQIVAGGLQEVPGDLRHRVLVPYIARPFYWLAKGRVGTWDPVFFGLLMANALFTATTAFILVHVAWAVAGSSVTALLAGMIYLLNFAVSNIHVAGFVESAQACFVMAIVWSLFTGRWWQLSVWSILGALAKETSVALLPAFAAGWCLAEARRKGLAGRQAGWVVVMAIGGFVALTVLMRIVSPYTPWTFASSHRVDSGYFYLAALLRCFFNRSFWYIFIWLLPLGMWRLGRLPRPWVMGAAMAAIAAVAMGAYSEAADNTARPLFNVAGPLLSLSVSVLLAPPGGTYQK